MNKKSIYFYVDMDAFFASVEASEHPELRDKPFAVTGRSNGGGVVSCANYIARKMGVRSASPVFKAKLICPELVLVPGSMDVYKKYSDKVMNILSNFSPDFYQMSIDEAWLDMKGMGNLYASVKECATSISSKIKNEVGITCSIGISWDLVVAKMASDYKKPDGITVVPEGQEIKFVDTCGIDKLYGVGEYTKSQLKLNSIDTTERLRAYSKEQLQSIFGNVRGEYLFNVSRGCAGARKAELDKKRKSHSISLERTFDEALVSKEAVFRKIDEYADKLFSQCLDEHLRPKTVGIKIKYSYDKFLSAQFTAKSLYFMNVKQIADSAKELFVKKHTGEAIRLLGLELSSFLKEDELISLLDFFNEDVDYKLSKIDKVSYYLAKQGLLVKRGALFEFKDK